MIDEYPIQNASAAAPPMWVNQQKFKLEKKSSWNISKKLNLFLKIKELWSWINCYYLLDFLYHYLVLCLKFYDSFLYLTSSIKSQRTVFSSKSFKYIFAFNLPSILIYAHPLLLRLFLRIIVLIKTFCKDLINSKMLFPLSDVLFILFRCGNSFPI